MIDLFSLAFITLLGAMSPGPAFAIVTRYILTGSSKAAFHASLGISLALLVHVTFCALGIALILFQYPLVFRSIQIAGSCYLGYLGLRLLTPTKKDSPHYIPHPKQSFITGFFSNLLNPKTTLFIFGIFTQFVNANTTWYTLIVYGLIISGVSLAWYSSLILLMSHPYFKYHFECWQHLLMKGMGLLLLGLAATVFIKTVT
jgi:threonine/homoserine/homoserine lactone efflux protein